MAFSRQAAENLLVECRRCCCICHTFCGPDIEIHHIVPKAKGGTHDEDNGIPLCYRCHAAVHAYSESPKGRKYTESELRRHRDEWFFACGHLSYEEMDRIKTEIINYIESLNIPLIHDTLNGISASLESLIKAINNENQRKEFLEKSKVELISDPKYFARLGELELQFQSFDQAVDHLSRSLELKGDQASVNYNLYKAELGRGNFDAAMAAYNRAIELDENLESFPKDYEIVEILGKGASGVVYKAEDSVGNEFAIKVLTADKIRDYNFIKALENEVKVLSNLRHQSIPTLYDFGIFKGRYFLVYEYLKSSTFDQLIASGTMTLYERISTGLKIAEALHYLHINGIVHGDIKPTNILLYRKPNVFIKLLDFGLSLRIDEIFTSKIRGGTLAYMPPEALTMPPYAPDDRTIFLQSDIYSFGVTLYEIFTGKLPSLNEKPMERLDNYSLRIRTLIQSMLNPDPISRPTIETVSETLAAELIEIQK